MSATVRAALVALVLGLCSAGPYAADLSLEVSFSAGEIKLISAWFEEHGQPGIKNKGRKNLPPGIAKNLRRGKPLPPGIARQVLPSGLVDRLPPVQEGYERVLIDGKVLLVEIATQVIHDALVDLVLE